MKSFGIIAALGAIVIFAGSPAIGRSGSANGLNGLDQTAIRYAFSSLVLLPLTIWYGRAVLARHGWFKLVALSVLGGAGYNAVYMSGFVFAPVAYGAALVPGLQPIFALVLLRFLFGDRLSLRVAIGPIICLFGLFVLTAAGGVKLEPAHHTGIGLFVLAALLWCSYTVVLKAWQVDPHEALATTALISALAFLPFYFAVRGVAPVLAAPLHASLLQLVHHGILVGIAATYLYSFAVKNVGSFTVSSLVPATRILAIVIGWWLVDESLTLEQIIGVAIVSAGLLVGTWLAARRPQSPRPVTAADR